MQLDEHTGVRLVLNTIRGIFFIGAFILFVLLLFFDEPFLHYSLSCMAALLFLSALKGISRIFGLMSFLFIVSTVIISVMYAQIDWQTFVLGFDYMMYLIIFIGILPVISLPLRIGGYMDHIARYIKKLSTYISSYATCNISNFSMGSFVNMAALPISYSLFINKRSLGPISYHYMVLISRSISLTVLWTPVGITVPMSVLLTGASFGPIVAMNLVLSIGGLWLSAYLAKRAYGHEEIEGEESESTPFSMKDDVPILMRIFIPFLLYIIYLLVTNHFTPFNMIEVIIMSIIPIVLIWSLFLSRLREFFHELKLYISTNLPHNYSQFAVLLSAGFFIYTLENVGFIQLAQSSLPSFSPFLEPPVYIVATLLVMLGLSQIGVHQFVTFVLVGTIIDPQLFGIHPNVYATTLMTGITLCMTSSPFSGINILMSSLMSGLSSSQVGRHNTQFVIIFGSAMVVIMMVMNIILMHG